MLAAPPWLTQDLQKFSHAEKLWCILRAMGCKHTEIDTIFAWRSARTRRAFYKRLSERLR